LRYTLPERIMHWVAGLTYLYLLVTGLAFYTPRLYWLAVMLGGGPTSRLWHPLIGLAFTASVLWMWYEWRADMRATEADRAWKATFRHYVRNEDDQVAGVGRFNPGQKGFFWMMFWGGLALLLSGMAMWFTEYIPWSLYWLRHLAILVHVVAALLTIGAFIIHFYMGTAVVREGLVLSFAVRYRKHGYARITRFGITKLWEGRRAKGEPLFLGPAHCPRSGPRRGISVCGGGPGLL
jgi:formate dehydrogenase subunit gamma